LGFFALNIIGSVWAEMFLIKRATLLANVAMLGTFGDKYLYFIVLREGLNRQGFSLKAFLGWWTTAYFICMTVGVLQVMNIGGFGEKLDIYVGQAAAMALQDGPSQPYMERGLMAHANALASQMPFVMALCLGILYQQPKRPWLWFLVVFSLYTTFNTYSRTGLLVTFILGFAWAGYLLAKGRTKAGTGVLAGAAAVVALGVGLVFALDMKKYKEIFVKQKTHTSAADISVMRRAQMSGMAFRTGSEMSPVFGVMPTEPGIQTIAGIAQNAYNPRLVLFGQYPTLYVRYGLVGIAWLMGILLSLTGFVLPKFKNHPFGVSAFICGIALAIHGSSESLSTDEMYMIQINLIMGLAIAVRMPEPKAEERTPFGMKRPTNSPAALPPAE
jgi:hypothetical protein